MKYIYKTDMILPPGGAAAWTNIVANGKQVDEYLPEGWPYVQAYAVFEDGTQVMMAVIKCEGDVGVFVYGSLTKKVIATPGPNG